MFSSEHLNSWWRSFRIRSTASSLEKNQRYLNWFTYEVWTICPFSMGGIHGNSHLYRQLRLQHRSEKLASIFWSDSMMPCRDPITERQMMSKVFRFHYHSQFRWARIPRNDWDLEQKLASKYGKYQQQKQTHTSRSTKHGIFGRESSLVNLVNLKVSSLRKESAPWVKYMSTPHPRKLTQNDAWENVSSFNYGYFWYLMLNFRSVRYMNNTQVETLQSWEYQQCPGDVNCSTSPTLRNWKIFDRIYGVPWLVAAVTGFFGRFTPRLVKWSEFTIHKTNSLPLKIGRAPKGK